MEQSIGLLNRPEELTPMSATPADEFDRRLADLPEWISRDQITWLTRANAKTVERWTNLDGFPDSAPVDNPTAPRLYPRDQTAVFLRNHLFDVEGAFKRSGPRPEPTTPFRAQAGERLTLAEIGRRRGNNSSNPSAAVRRQAVGYAYHPDHPFPAEGDDRMRDAVEVRQWYRWYDKARPGQVGRTSPSTTAEVMTTLVRTRIEHGEQLTTEAVAAELNISPRTASEYLRKFAPAVLDELQLVSISDVAQRLPDHQRDTKGRRERAKWLLRDTKPVVRVGNSDYYAWDVVKPLIR